ncbi:hypothetical protein JCM10213_003273 [Rhodosporidiobolus nylandii]
MPVPHLPEELVVKILKHLWADLSTDASTGEPVIPRTAPFVFAPLLRVSKAFHRLALPFWLGHVETADRVRAEAVVKKHGLKNMIRSLYYDPEIPPWHSDWDDPNYEDSEEEDYYDGGYSFGDPYGYGGRGYRKEPGDEYWEEMGQEEEKWRTIFEHSGSFEQLEIGPRWPRVTRRGVQGRRFTYYNNDDHEAQKTEPAGKTLLQMVRVGSLSGVRSLRLNLPAGATITDVSSFLFSLPNLEHARLTFFGPLAPDEPEAWTPYTAPPKVRTLEVLRLRSSVQHLQTVVIERLVKPFEATLHRLSLDYTLSDASVSLTSTDLFRECTFPILQQITLSGRLVCVARTPEPFIPNAPVLEIAEIPAPRTGVCPPPPPSLEHLSLTRLRIETLPRLEQTFRIYATARAIPSLRSLTIEFEVTDPKLSEGQLGVLRTLAACAEQHGVALLGSWWPLLSSNAMEDALYDPASEADDEDDGNSEEGGEEEGDVEMGATGSSSGDSDGESMLFDWDGEDGPQFRSLWSAEKRRAHDFAEALSALQLHFSSLTAFEGARAAMIEAAEPFLHGERE